CPDCGGLGDCRTVLPWSVRGTTTASGCCGREAVSVPGAVDLLSSCGLGTTTMTTSPEGTGAPPPSPESSAVRWLPGTSLFWGSTAHSPRSSATTAAYFWPSAVMVTIECGAARPAMTVPPSGFTRTISKLGLTGAGTAGVASAV